MNFFTKNTVYNVLTFGLWTVTSFICHYFGKRSFNTSVNASQKTGSAHNLPMDRLYFQQIIPAVLLTVAQLALCHYFMCVDVPEAKSSCKKVKVYHALATLATNISMALMPSSSTFAIKMMEPMSSAMIQYMVTGSKLSHLTAASLPFIIGGSIAFCWNASGIFSIQQGIFVALISNIMLGFRNIEIKTITANSSSPFLTLRFGKRNMASSLAAAIVVLLVTLLLEFHDMVPPSASKFLICVFLSGTFHVVYNYVSTALVLSQISVLSHALANIMKRLLVVLLLYLLGPRQASGWNFTGLGVCTVGLLLYAWDKATFREREINDQGLKKTTYPRKWNKAMIAWPGLYLLLFTSIFLMFDYRPSMEIFKHYSITRGLIRENRNINVVEHQDIENCLPRKPTITNINFPQALSLDFVNVTKLRPPTTSVTGVNIISRKLTTSLEIIKETQMLHFNIIGKELANFKYAFLMDIATFENKGDPAITVGQVYFLARMNIEIVYFCTALSECKDPNLIKARKLAEKYNPSELVILFQGGGNIIAYQTREIPRFKMMEQFSKFKMLIFPQSIRIDDWDHPDVNKSISKYCCNPNLTLVLRDRFSYDIARKLYNGTTRLLLAPDIAFQIGHVPRTMSPVFDVLWIKRTDKETPGYKPPKKVPKDLRVHVADWLKWKTPQGAKTGLQQAFYIANNGFFFLQRGRVVITDRLHGHILSVLMDIPHVLIDNAVKKLSSYHITWNESLKNTVLTDDPSKALGLAIGLLKKYNDTLPPLVPGLNLRSNLGDPGLGITDIQ